MFIEIINCQKFIIDINSSIRESIKAIEDGGLKIALVVDKENKLIGTICDGDIRRGLLRDIAIESPISEVIQRNYITASEISSKQEIYSLMRNHKVSQIPILDDNGKILGIEIAKELSPNFSNKFGSALLMAGGEGKRLRPLTYKCPKPLLEIEGKPILEIILEKCINSGINKFFISVCYMADQIVNYFGDGSKWDVEINYLEEDKPLGTAGALSLLPKDSEDPILLINGDVLTRVNFQDVLNYHRQNNGYITICAREHILQSPYGVIEVNGIKYQSMVEKPTFKHLVNAGIYCLDSEIITSLKKNEFLDMPNLINSLKAHNKNIIVYPVHEYWIDIGKPELLKKAHYEWKSK